MTTSVQGKNLNQDTPVVNLHDESVSHGSRRFVRAFLRNRIAVIGLVIVAIMVFAALFGPNIAPYNPNKTSSGDRLQPPGSEFFLGTDEFGRDIVSRLLYGARVSLEVAFIAQTISVVIGIAMGLISGWYGGWIDDAIMRLTDALFALPSLVFLIVWVSILEPSKQSIFLSLGLIGWASVARMMRSQVLVLKELDYVTAARALGATPPQIMMRHILPNGLAPVIVLASLGVAGVILAESGLSFLGLGVQIPNPSWGSMIDTGRNYFTNAWWYAIFPGVTIMITVLGFNFVGDGLRDALDPKQYD